MPNKINGPSSLNRIKQSQQVEQKQSSKTNRQFQSFIDDALKSTPETSSINISNHAQKRMDQRGIEFDQTDMTNLNEAFETLTQKGGNNSLILYDDLSLIASVKNKTIITASKTAEMTEVTNIDSAIHIQK